MKKEQKLCAMLCILVLVFLPCCVFAAPDVQGSASSSLVTSTTATPVMPPVEDKGNFLERSIAGLVNNIADAMNGLIKFLTGFDDLDALLFSLPSNWNNERYPAPIDQETWNMLDSLYGGISIVAYGLFMLLPLVASFRFLGGAFTKSPRARAEAMQTLWRMVIAAVAIMAIPAMFRMFLIAANAIQGLVATAVANSYSDGLGISGEFLENIRTGSVLLTSIVRIGFVFISLQIGVLYAVRKIVLSTMYVFTPLMLVLWVIKKDVTAASVWVGEMLTNSFLLTAYALSAGVVAFILGGSQSWVVKLLAVYMIVPLGNTLRNGLQNLFTRWAGIDEERIAGGFAGTMASAFGMQSITRMVGAMSMTFNGSHLPSESTIPVPANINKTQSGGGPWGVQGSVPATIETSSTRRPIGFQVPLKGEKQDLDQDTNSFIPAEVRDLLSSPSDGGHGGGMEAAPVVIPDMPNPWGRTEKKPELFYGRSEKISEVPRSKKQEQQYQKQKYSQKQHTDPERYKTFLRLQKWDTTGQIVGGAVGLGARVVNFVGFASPVTKSLANGIARGAEWISQKTIYGTGIAVEAIRATRRKHQEKKNTSIVREFLELNRGYKEWAKHPYIPGPVQAQIQKEKYDKMLSTTEKQEMQEMQEESPEQGKMELVYVSVNGTKVAFLKNAKVPGRSLDVVEGAKSEGKRAIGFSVPEEVERRLMVEKVFRKMQKPLAVLEKEDFKEQTRQLFSSFAKTLEEQKSKRQETSFLDRFYELKGLQVDDPDKIYF